MKVSYFVDEAVPLAENHAEVEELQVKRVEDTVRKDVADVEHQVHHVSLAAKMDETIQVSAGSFAAIKHMGRKNSNVDPLFLFIS